MTLTQGDLRAWRSHSGFGSFLRCDQSWSETCRVSAAARPPEPFRAPAQPSRVLSHTARGGLLGLRGKTEVGEQNTG